MNPDNSQVQKTPKILLTPTQEADTLKAAESPMPATGSITKEQLERDLLRAKQDALDANERIELLRKMLARYFPDSTALLDDAPVVPSERIGRFTEMSIPSACEVVFDELQNQWLSLADLDMELRRRGKICNKGSIEIGIKSKGGAFEIVKRGKKNYYRRRVGPKVVNLKPAEEKQK